MQRLGQVSPAVGFDNAFSDQVYTKQLIHQPIQCVVLVKFNI